MINATKMAIAGAIAVVFTLMSAGIAQAYPDPVVKITVGDARFVGGLPLTYTATSSVSCKTFVVSFNGETQTGSGTSVSGTFSTPKVSTITPKPITATCSYGSTGASVASDAATITLLPVGADTVADTVNNNGVLPNTGGSNVWILVVGGALVLVGGGAVVAARRRS